MKTRFSLGMAIVLLAVFAGWCLAARLVARQLDFAGLVEVGDVEGVRWVLRWDKRARDRSYPVHCAFEYAPQFNNLDPWRRDTEVIIQMTPLMVAAKQGNTEMLELLLVAGASPVQQNPDGWTPLHVAAAFGRPESVLKLGESGLDTNVKDCYGRTPLHWAAGWGDRDLIRALHDAGAKVDAQDQDGESPLVYAILQQRSEAVSLLLQLGADIYLTDKTGDTPRRVIEWNGSEEVNAILNRHLKARGEDVEAPASNDGLGPEDHEPGSEPRRMWSTKEGEEDDDWK